LRNDERRPERSGETQPGRERGTSGRSRRRRRPVTLRSISDERRPERSGETQLNSRRDSRAAFRCVAGGEAWPGSLIRSGGYVRESHQMRGQPLRGCELDHRSGRSACARPLSRGR